jgi:glyoxylase-like metal-dependent hydrolase (beta-lactamase superfamily II)
VLRGIAGGIAAAALPAVVAQDAATGNLYISDLAPGVKVIDVSSVNIVTLATNAGLVVVDSGNETMQRTVLDRLRQVAGANGKLAVLVNTHWHRDQTGANEALAQAGATIVAHDKTRQRLRAGWYVPAVDAYRPPLPAAALPTKTFFTTEQTTVGDRRIELGYLLNAHTDGDAYVRFPEANVIAAGDAISPLADPVLDWYGGGWLGGRVDALKKLLELGDARTWYVPSVGPPVQRAEVQAEHDWLLAIFDRMVVNLRLGQTPDDMRNAGVLDGLPRKLTDPAKFLYDAQKGFWANHNKLMHDIV